MKNNTDAYLVDLCNLAEYSRERHSICIRVKPLAIIGYCTLILKRSQHGVVGVVLHLSTSFSTLLVRASRRVLSIKTLFR